MNCIKLHEICQYRMECDNSLCKISYCQKSFDDIITALNKIYDIESKILDMVTPNLIPDASEQYVKGEVDIKEILSPPAKAISEPIQNKYTGVAVQDADTAEDPPEDPQYTEKEIAPIVPINRIKKRRGRPKEK